LAEKRSSSLITSATMQNQRTQRFGVMVKLLFALSATAVKYEIPAAGGKT
jgi:hypothetical protein